MKKMNWLKTACAVCALCAAAVIAAPAQNAVSFTTLHSFNFNTDGGYPDAALIQDTDGNLYGTTSGGARGDGGTIFKITPSGAFSTIYEFCSTGGLCAQNIGPRAPLVQATNGSLYGSTFGVAEETGFPGAIFEITGGTVRTLHSFCPQGGGCPDGLNPNAGLIQAADGNFYGATEFGGGCCVNFPFGCGTIFKMTPSGELTTLYSFCQHVLGGMCADGAYPLGALVQAAYGDFYGTTYQGGYYGGGTLFKITPSGTLTTLDVLCDGSGPCNYEPEVGLVQASDGNFYGTSYGGGTSGYGTIFKLSPTGTLTTIYGFCSRSGCTDGETPVAPLVEGTDGDLYGSTAFSGPTGQGTIFKITTSGKLTVLYGASASGLVQDTNGDFYGTTSTGGTYCAPYGCGTVFRLSVGLGPFVKTLPNTGNVGKSVFILGTDLTGATSVTFNGTTASFVVQSATAIKATVPDGATTGRLKVTIPHRTLTSNVNFRVTPTISSVIPVSGPVGTSVAIIGVSFTGATSVTFGGVKATFTVISNNQITATVPAGAKTGEIIVTTLGGTASAGTFTVTW